MRKLSNEVIDERLIGRGIKRLSDYVRNKVPIKWLCLVDICEHIWEARPNDVVGKKKKKSGCPKCMEQLPITNEYVDTRLVKDARNIQRLGNVIRNKVPIKFRCLVNGCFYTWDARPDSIINRGQGCPKCAGNILISNEEIDSLLIKHNRNIRRIGSCIGSKVCIDWLCMTEDCGYIWSASYNSVIIHGTGCSMCNRMGINEKLMLEAFKSADIGYTSQFKIRSLDVQAPAYKIDAFIGEVKLAVEYNGVQHYEVVDRFGGEEHFIKRQKRDQYVRDFCTAHDIELIEIDGRKYKSYKLTTYMNDKLIPYIKSKLDANKISAA